MKTKGRARFNLSILLSVLLTVGFLQCSLNPDVFTYRSQLARYHVAQRQTVLVRVANGQGSGFSIVRKDVNGKKHVFVWTAGHVVKGVNTAEVVVVHRTDCHKAGQTTYPARVMFRAKGTDAALLEVDGPVTHFVNTEFDFSCPVVGQPIFHIGNLYGIAFDGSLTTGLLSQVGINPGGDWPWRLVDQTTTLAVPGSSGGPIFNARNGKVLGILVGGPQTPGISCYVPVRELLRENNATNWFLKGGWCPSDSLLDGFANDCKVVEQVDIFRLR